MEGGVLTNRLDPAYNGALLANDHDVITVAMKSVLEVEFVTKMFLT